MVLVEKLSSPVSINVEHPLVRARKVLAELSSLGTPGLVRYLDDRLPIKTWSFSTSIRRREQAHNIFYISETPPQDERRDKPTLVWLPGALEGPEAARPFVEILSRSLGTQVMAVDYASFGGAKEFMDNFSRFLHAQGVSGKVILFGGSFGGMIAQMYQRLHPEKVEALILSHASNPDAPIYRKPEFRILYNLFHRLPPQTHWNLSKILLPLIHHRFSIDHVKVKSDVSEIDRIFNGYWKSEVPKRRRQNFKRMEWVHAFTSFAIDLTAGSRRAKKRVPIPNWNGEVLWIFTENDWRQNPLTENEAKSVYPNSEIKTLPPGYGHHSAYVHVEEMTDILVDFLSRFTQPLSSHT